MSKLYEVTVSTVLSKEFVIRANTPEDAQEYGLDWLKTELELSDAVESTSEVQFEFNTLDEYPMFPLPEVIDATNKKNEQL